MGISSTHLELYRGTRLDRIGFGIGSLAEVWVHEFPDSLWGMHPCGPFYGEELIPVSVEIHFGHLKWYRKHGRERVCVSLIFVPLGHFHHFAGPNFFLACRERSHNQHTQEVFRLSDLDRISCDKRLSDRAEIGCTPCRVPSLCLSS